MYLTLRGFTVYVIFLYVVYDLSEFGLVLRCFFGLLAAHGHLAPSRYLYGQCDHRRRLQRNILNRYEENRRRRERVRFERCYAFVDYYVPSILCSKRCSQIWQSTRAPLSLPDTSGVLLDVS